MLYNDGETMRQTVDRLSASAGAGTNESSTVLAGQRFLVYARRSCRHPFRAYLNERSAAVRDPDLRCLVGFRRNALDELIRSQSAA